MKNFITVIAIVAISVVAPGLVPIILLHIYYWHKVKHMYFIKFTGKIARNIYTYIYKIYFYFEAYCSSIIYQLNRAHLI